VPQGEGPEFKHQYCKNKRGRMVHMYQEWLPGGEEWYICIKNGFLALVKSKLSFKE
jgi:hypothetical protein